MKVAALIARILLGLMFLVFGLNGFLRFIPAGPLPSGMAGQFITVMMDSHYLQVVSALQVAGGVLLLINLYVPLGLVILGPIIANILLFHALIYRTGVPLAIIVVLLWCTVAFRYRQYFSGIFVQRAA
jgi:putative oxidoreductase